MSTSSYYRSSDPHATLTAAQSYVRRGLAVIPVPVGKKAPNILGWQRLRLTEEDLPGQFDGGAHNIGILLGEASGDVVDVDVDAAEGLPVASTILPDTQMISGHGTAKAKSHYIYRARIRTRKLPDPSDGTMLVELRSSGQQTLAPPSIHPSGEAYEFDRDGEPANVSPEELLLAVAELAAVALLARHWPAQGSRQDAALALGGTLLRAGLNVEETQRIVRLVCQAAQDEEVGKRVGAVPITAKRIADGSPAFGFHKLAELVGKEVARTAIRWITSDEQTEEKPVHERLEAAKALLNELLPDILKGDRGAVVDPGVIAAYKLVRAHDHPEWVRQKAFLKEQGLLRDVEAELRSRAGIHVVADGEHAGRTAGEMLADCPAAAVDLLIPPQYSLTPTSTIRIARRAQALVAGEEDVSTLVATSPILITGRALDLDSGSEHLELAYKKADAWHSRTVPRQIALDRQRINGLAEFGFPTSTSTSGSLVTYLQLMEGHNFGIIPVRKVVSHAGWLGRNGEFGFLAGRDYIEPSGVIVPGAGDAMFAGHGPGDEQIVRAIHSSGSLAGWMAGIKVVQHYARATFGLYTSFVPCILRIIKAVNFVLDIAGRTSIGKTSLLRLVASPWGNPCESSPLSLLHTFDSTHVFWERAACLLSDVPLALTKPKESKTRECSMLSSSRWPAAEARAVARSAEQPRPAPSPP